MEREATRGPARFGGARLLPSPPSGGASQAREHARPAGFPVTAQDARTKTRRHSATLIWLAALVLFLLPGCARDTGRERDDAAPARSSRTSASRQHLGERELEHRAEAYARFATGVAHDLRNEPGEAETALEASLVADPTNEDLALELAQRYLRTRRPARAAAVLTTASRQPEASAQVFGWLGATQLQLTNQPAAIQAYREAMRRAPQSIIGYHGLAQIHLQAGHTNEALNVLDAAAARPDATPPLLVDLAGFYIAAARQRLLPTEVAHPRALALLDQTSRLHPTDPQVLERLAEGYKVLGETKRATAFFEELLRDHPPDEPARRLALREELFRLYAREGDTARAGQQLEGILADYPTNPQVHLLLGALCVDQEKYAEAEQHLEKAILLDPTIEPAYYDLVGVQLALNQPDLAWETIETARSRFRPAFLLELYTGLVLVAREEYVEALNHFDSAELHARVSDPSRLNDFFYFQVGAANERAGRRAEAEAALRKCLELDPKHAEALNYLGYMWAERGENLAEARAMIERAVELKPNTPAYLDSLAWVLFKQGEAGQALKHQLRAIELSKKPDATLLDHLGDIYAALGRPTEARDAWRKSLELEPNPDVEKKLRAEPAPGRQP